MSLADVPENGRGVKTKVFSKTVIKTVSDDKPQARGRPAEGFQHGRAYDQQPWQPFEPHPDQAHSYGHSSPFHNRRHNEFAFYEEDANSHGGGERQQREEDYSGSGHEGRHRDNDLNQDYRYDQDHQIDEEGFFDEFVVDFSDTFHNPKKDKQGEKEKR